MSAMSAHSDRWGAASSSSQVGPVLVGEEMGLPLIQCPDCKRERVVENTVKTCEKVNYSRVSSARRTFQGCQDGAPSTGDKRHT
ncbi:hypothetical protein U9M48_009015 [Paspalum notatum var. saurae]|uniref:Uncharacterized protein n=1 Tax=Paspalum notatum var. saurae TaxID=547442 RepID=A0AAQ3SQC2_PASNO